MRELRIESVSLAYNFGEPNEVQVLKGCSLRVFSGSPLIINGGNGSGKSTLLKAIAGRIAPVSGTIRIIGLGDGEFGSPRWLLENVDYVPQAPVEALIPDLTLAEHLALYAIRRSSMFDPYVPSRIFTEEESRFIDLMGKYRVYKHRRVMDLSGGEQQLFALALAQYRSLPIVLLDEPTAALDRQKIKDVEDRLKSWLGSAEIISVIVTHDHSFAERLGFQSRAIEDCV